MKRSIRFTGLAFLLFVPILAIAAGLPPQYANTPTAKDYPKADVLVLSESRAFTLAPDGRVTEKVRKVEKMLTYQGMDEAGDPHVAFNKESQELVVSLCRSYTPEGIVRDAKPNSFNEMTPFDLEKSPAYTSWREMVITKVGLDLNAVVELEYTITDKRPWRHYLEGVEVLQDGDPALVREVSVTVPAGTALKCKLFGWNAQPAVSGSTTTVTLQNVPGLDPGQGHGPSSEFLPTFVFTTAPDWKSQADRLAAAVEKAEASTSPALDKKVEELVKGVEGAFDQILKVHDYVAEGINTVEWPMADFDYAPRAAAEIFDGGYGHALDKAVLLCAMLRKIGRDPKIALGRQALPGGLDPAAVPCLAQMDGLLVRVEKGSGVLWLDPTAKLSDSSQKDFVGFKGLPLVAGMAELHEMTPVEGASDFLWASLEAKAKEDLSLEGEATVTMAGHYSPYFAVQGCKDSQKKALEGFVGSVLPGASVSEFSVVRMEPGQAVFRVSFKVEAPKAGAVKSLKTGLPDGSLLKKYNASYLAKRELPLVLPSAGEERLVLKVTLPEGMKPTYLPKDAKLENAAGSFSQTCAVKDGVLEVKCEAKVNGRVVSVQDYPGFRALYGLANDRPTRTILF